MSDFQTLKVYKECSLFVNYISLFLESFFDRLKEMDDEKSRRLFELRQVLCLTQKEFGGKIHISKGYVTSLEKCRQPLNDRIIKLLADTYGVNPEWLKYGKNPMFFDPQKGRLTEIITIFNQLNPDFQNFVISQLKNLLEMNHNYQTETDPVSKDNSKNSPNT
jgi:transcriptional regulator with XRE-family HTH domain